MLISFHPVFHHLHPFHRSKSFRASNPPGIKVTNHTHGRLELPLPKMYYYDEGGGHNYVRVYNTWNFSATSTRLYESIKHFSLLSSVIDQVQLLLLLLSLSLPQLLRAGKDVLVSFHPVFSHDFRGGLHTFESAFAPCLYVYLNLVFVHPHFPFPKCSAPPILSAVATHVLSFTSLPFGHQPWKRLISTLPADQQYIILLFFYNAPSNLVISTINHSVCALAVLQAPFNPFLLLSECTSLLAIQTAQQSFGHRHYDFSQPIT